MEYSTVLLPVLAVVSVNLVFITAILHYRFEPRLILSYFASVLLNAALYFQRRLLRRGAALLRRGLGYVAIVLGAFLSALFFYSVAAVGTQMSLGVGVWVVIAVAAYFFYRLTMLHLEDEEVQQYKVQARVRPRV